MQRSDVGIAIRKLLFAIICITMIRDVDPNDNRLPERRRIDCAPDWGLENVEATCQSRGCWWNPANPVSVYSVEHETPTRTY